MFQLIPSDYQSSILTVICVTNLFSLLQIENEYGDIERVYGDGGKPYAMWAASMALSQNTGVPWIMCQQYDAPDPVVRGIFEQSSFFV